MATDGLLGEGIGSRYTEASVLGLVSTITAGTGHDSAGTTNPGPIGVHFIEACVRKRPGNWIAGHSVWGQMRGLLSHLNEQIINMRLHFCNCISKVLMGTTLT